MNISFSKFDGKSTELLDTVKKVKISWGGPKNVSDGFKSYFSC